MSRGAGTLDTPPPPPSFTCEHSPASLLNSLPPTEHSPTPSLDSLPPTEHSPPPPLDTSPPPLSSPTYLLDDACLARRQARQEVRQAYVYLLRPRPPSPPAPPLPTFRLLTISTLRVLLTRVREVVSPLVFFAIMIELWHLLQVESFAGDVMELQRQISSLEGALREAILQRRDIAFIC